VDCLRPWPPHYAELLGDGRRSRPGPLGVLYWEAIARYDLGAFRRAWGEVRMDQLNAEVVIIAHRMAGVIRAKYRALGRLYWGLGGSIVSPAHSCLPRLCWAHGLRSTLRGDHASSGTTPPLCSSRPAQQIGR
jgi:hypothetical protein